MSVKNYTMLYDPSSKQKIRIGEVRFSYANVWEPKETPGGVKQYSVSILIPKENTAGVDLVKKAIDAAIAEGTAKLWGGKQPKNLHLPLRDGDEERDDPVYEGMYFMNANNKKSQPKIQVNEGGVLVDALGYEDFYSGCYGIAWVTIKPYDNSGNRGVTAYLDVVAKTRDGEALTGSFNSNLAFAGLDLD